MDEKTGKLMAMHEALPLKDDVDRLYISKRRGKKTYQHWRQRWHIDTMTLGLHRKARKRTVYSHQKRYWQHDGQHTMTITRKRKWGKKTLSVLND